MPAITVNSDHIQQLADGLAFYALAACVIGICISAAMWAMGSKGQNPGQELTGKKGIVLCCSAAFFVGALAPFVNYLQGAAATIDPSIEQPAAAQVATGATPPPKVSLCPQITDVVNVLLDEAVGNSAQVQAGKKAALVDKNDFCSPQGYRFYSAADQMTYSDAVDKSKTTCDQAAGDIEGLFITHNNWVPGIEPDIAWVGAYQKDLIGIVNWSGTFRSVCPNTDESHIGG